jgi:hypothetical protein
MDSGLDVGFNLSFRSGWGIVDGAEVHVRESWLLVFVYMEKAPGVIGDLGSVNTNMVTTKRNMVTKRKDDQGRIKGGKEMREDEEGRDAYR